MIRSIRLRDFKNFDDATLSVGAFTVIVGPNSSGKSNIRDAFRFIHGIGRGYSLADIVGGRYGAGGQSEWAQMRGAASEIMRFGTDSFEIDVEVTTAFGPYIYKIRVEKPPNGRNSFVVARETLRRPWAPVFDSHPGQDDPVHAQDEDNVLLLRMEKTESQKKWGTRVAARADTPAISQIVDNRKVSKGHREAIQTVLDVFAGIRFLDLVPEQMRKPAFPGQAVLGDNGENLPTVLQEICLDPARKEVLTEWIRELTPMDVSDFEFPSDPITGLVQLSIREANGAQVSAYSASDGTLRFLAMLAALLGGSPAELYFFEEIDNGIHPARLRLLLELIENQTRKGEVQVVTTTHSPELLGMVSDDTFSFTSVVYRHTEAASSGIKRVEQLPQASELRTREGLGSLHATGWIEDALVFAGA